MYLRFLAEDLRDLIGNLGVFTFPEDVVQRVHDHPDTGLDNDK